MIWTPYVEEKKESMERRVGKREHEERTRRADD